MSTQAFYNVLKENNLDQYYPDFLSKGIRTPYSLSKLTMQDYSQLGVRSIDDKRKFMELTHVMKSQQQQEERLARQEQQEQERQKQQQRQKKESPPQTQQIRKPRLPAIPTEQQRKRPAITVPSPDRKLRRLTLGSPYIQPSQQQQQQRQPMTTPIPRVAPPRFDTTPSTTRRRLSYAPSKQPNVSPKRTSNTHPPKSSPSRVGAPSTTSKFGSSKLTPSDDPFLSDKRKATLNQRQPDRHLDTYGIPKSGSRGRLSGENYNYGSTSTSNATTNTSSNNGNNGNPVSGMSLDEYMDSKMVLDSASSSAAAPYSSLPNGTPPSAPPTKTVSLNQSLPSDLQQRIRVCVRKRPLSRKEVANGEIDISELVGAHTIKLNAPKSRVDLTRYVEQHSFTFDEAFDGNSSNVDIYYRTARPLVHYVFGGGKATCFAFGQTGSGKTYTMLDPQHGLYIMAAKDIFEMLEDPSYRHLSASVGFYEIYQGKLYDLLNKRKQLIPREDGNNNVVIAGLLEYKINDLAQLLQIFDFGSQCRTTGKTGANDNSSRSHAVLQVLLKDNKTDGIHGKLSFIDLAGSERGADRGDANPKTRMEGAEINKSLLALKECIRALDKVKKHTPFRGSKLTQVLRDSFVGDSRTCMIATISPNNSNSEHTLNTLRYADRVKELKGESDPRLQVDPPSLDDNTGETYYEEYSRQNSSSSRQRDDSHSVATFDEEFWDGNTAENLMDEDFPVDAISNNALGTPRSQRVWPESTSHRKETYLRRLSSPPADLFRQIADDPFSSEQSATSPSPKSPHAMQKQQRQQRQRHSTNDASKSSSSSSPSTSSRLPASGSRLSTTASTTPKQQDEFYDAHDEPATPQDQGNPSTPFYDTVPTTTTSRQVSVDQIRDFMRLQRTQVTQLEALLKEEKRWSHKFNLTVASYHGVDGDDTGPPPIRTPADDEKVTLLYEAYLNHVEDILDRKLGCVDAVKERVKQELGDEELDDLL